MFGPKINSFNVSISYTASQSCFYKKLKQQKHEDKKFNVLEFW